MLGVRSVPDGLATGLMAGLSPLNGLYAHRTSTLVGAAVTSSSFMVVQGTGVRPVRAFKLRTVFGCGFELAGSLRVRRPARRSTAGSARMSSCRVLTTMTAVRFSAYRGSTVCFLVFVLVALSCYLT